MPAFNPITPKECAAKIKNAKNIAVLSGAGMSTAAGVPDFRGPKGLYVTREYDPETVFEIHYFDRDPKPFYQFSRDFLGMLKNITPTFTHRFLAELESQGKNIAVITQNIDGLHQRAGSKRVYPIHGDYETSHCRSCGAGFKGSTTLEAMMEKDEVPVCVKCGGVIKPDVVFFGENVRHLQEAYDAAAKSDLMFVLGSSLTVYPAAAIPYEAGGEVVIVNKGAVAASAGEKFYLADTQLDEFFAAAADELKQ